MKVLITGSSGLIGRWVADRLKMEGCQVIGLDKAPPPAMSNLDESIQVDILNQAALLSAVRQTAPDALIHLAARIDLNETRKLNGYAANIEGVRNVIESVRQTPTIRRFISTSSQLVCRVGYVPQSETDYCPNTLYGQSKVLTEQITRERDGGGKEWCLVRPTTVWGPYMGVHYQGLLKLIQNGRYFHCGHSPLNKSYSFVGNIAYQYWKLLAAPATAIHGKTFYLADYEPLSLRAYTNALAKELGAPLIPTVPLPFARFLAVVGDVFNAVGWRSFPFNNFRLNNILTEYQFDLSPTRAVCGELPYGFEDGIGATVKWFLGANECRSKPNSTSVKIT